MLSEIEILGLLVGDSAVRDADGSMRLQDVSPDSVMGRHAMSTGCFRRSKPILDPVTREVMGYEMEMVPHAFGEGIARNSSR
jgi:hypothetical protein